MILCTHVKQPRQVADTALHKYTLAKGTPRARVHRWTHVVRVVAVLEQLWNDARDYSCPHCLASLPQSEPLPLLQRNVVHEGQGQLSVISWHHHFLPFWQLGEGEDS